MFPDEEVENIIGSVRPEVCALGLMDTKENCWKFFIDRVRRQLKVRLLYKRAMLVFFLFCFFFPGISQVIVQRKVVFNDFPSGKIFAIELFQRTASQFDFQCLLI